MKKRQLWHLGAPLGEKVLKVGALLGGVLRGDGILEDPIPVPNNPQKADMSLGIR